MKTKRISNVSFSVWKTKIGLKTYYICLSGGELRDGEVVFTEIGELTVEALGNLPIPFDHHAMNFQELKIGSIPLRTQIKQTLLKLPNHSKVCLFGDMVGELDGVIIEALNVVRSPQPTMPVICSVN